MLTQFTDTIQWAAGGHTDPEGAARYLGTSKITLARWRCERKGPSYLKIGGRIRYLKRELESFQKRHTVHTSDCDLREVTS